MLIYENTFPSTYEEIKTWYPVWYREIFEMDALWQVFGGQMDKIQSELIRMIDNNFIKFADAPTLAKLEAFFGITHPFPRTLVERRTVLLGSIHSLGRMGRPQIIEIISLFTNGDIDVRFFVPGKIKIAVTRDFGDMFNPADIHLILGHRVPAHLGLEVIDAPYPVSVINRNDFILRSLAFFRFRIGNITAPQILLNGDYALDGSWLLGAGLVHGKNFIDFHIMAITHTSSELSVQKLDIGVFSLRNKNHLNRGVLSKSKSWLLNGEFKLDAGHSAGVTLTLDRQIIEEVLL